MGESTRKPWYAAALVAGFGAVLGVSTLTGLPARGGQEPRVAVASVGAPGTLSLDERLTRIESAIEKLQRAWDKLPNKCRTGDAAAE